MENQQGQPSQERVSDAQLDREQERINERLHRTPEGLPAQASGKGSQSEPRPSDENPEPMFEDTSSPPLNRGGELRGDQQMQTTEAQFGAMKKGTKHRGRS